jgi:hypothetical protein
MPPPPPPPPPHDPALDALYVSTSQGGRDAWFAAVRTAPRSDVWTVLGSTAPLGARGQEAAVELHIAERSRAVSFTRRAVSALGDGLRAAAAHGRRYVWVPLRLSGGPEVHANAVWVDLAAEEAYAFEPHGGDPSDAAHGRSGFRHFYDRSSYGDALQRLVGAAAAHAGLPRALSLYVPDDYMPPAWGQSLTADRWCALWCLLFLDGATRFGPTALVDAWAGAEYGEVVEALRSAPRWMRVHAAYLR